MKQPPSNGASFVQQAEKTQGKQEMETGFSRIAQGIGEKGKQPSGFHPTFLIVNREKTMCN